MKKTIATLFLALLPLAAGAASEAHGSWWEPAKNDVSNVRSLQRGAKYYVNYCLGCHSLKYVRWSSLMENLDLSEEQLVNNLMFGVGKPTDMITGAMPKDDAQTWFGQAPPDLTLTARSRGVDWIYNYLRTFYLEEDRPTGVNNLVLDNAGMPHVLAELQGYQVAHFRKETDAEGNPHRVFEGFELIQKGRLTPAEYDQVVRDIVNFLDYAGEPMQVERKQLGIGVLAFLLVFFLFAFFLKREFWRDVH